MDSPEFDNQQPQAESTVESEDEEDYYYIEHRSTLFGQEFYSGTDLRDGLVLDFDQYYRPQDECLKTQDREHPLEYRFYWTDSDRNSRMEYSFWGSGFAPQKIISLPSYKKRRSELIVHMEPELFLPYVGNKNEELPPMFCEFVKPYDHVFYHSNGRATLEMQRVVKQIVHCPFQGLIRRIYLDSKVTELMMLLIHREAEKVQGRNVLSLLKPEDIERIYYARDILLTYSDRLPPLFDLAQQVGLNEYKLKLGFKQVFGTTIFHYFHCHRLELAKQQLLLGEMTIAEVALSVGFANRGYFAKAFRQQFGYNPGQMKPKIFR